MLSTGKQKTPVREDWHPAYISYQLRLKGLSARRLARQHGYAPNAVAVAIGTPWPKIQRIVADALGVEPQEIWPSRYEADGTPKLRASIASLQRTLKNNTTSDAGNVHMKRSA